ncbi:MULTISPECIES: GNAT family N-acetyltransferase [unclassified Streptomyces]|uniref:GNAT family N-acetyltransferase n=1 Tax=unclassified Streptomyces TaxID=2593676 RepID=UPI0029AE47BE|nr:GNAT family N-acetyltransferase [Streptomyces sp. DK15]MDX2388618.1 GNAT family N-acetyltransferase [Streptomyces sp. DK15]
MISVTVDQPGRPGPAPTSPQVRTGRTGDAPALHALSAPFVRSGALRSRPPEHYRAHAGRFLVVEGDVEGSVRGCVALRGAEPGTAVLYNFCVAVAGQGRGIGAALLFAACARARAEGRRALFTATTGSARLFVRYGFRPVAAAGAPPGWAARLDPARGSRVLRLSL